MPDAEILSQGDEVITGQTLDSNAAWLGEQLTLLGFTVRRHTTVGDRLADIREALQEASRRVQFCICSGGLGPTDDDLTARAAAEAFGRALQFDAEAMLQIEAMFARFGREMPEINRKQAWFPQGAGRIDNRWGTAPGFAMDGGDAWLAFLPGVPREMRKIFAAEVEPRLRQRFALQPGRLVTLRTAGVGESALQERIGSWEPAEAVLGFRTMAPENQIKLRFAANTPDQQIRSVARDLARRIGDAVFSVEGVPGVDGMGGSLAEAVIRLLRPGRQTVAAVEIGTCGELARLCGDGQGDWEWLLETYGRPAGAQHGELEGLLPVPLAEGAPAKQTVCALARAARARASACYGLAVLASSGDGSPGSAGLNHVAVADAAGVEHREVRVLANRNLNRRFAAAGVLNLLRLHICRRSNSSLLTAL